MRVLLFLLSLAACSSESTVPAAWWEGTFTLTYEAGGCNQAAVMPYATMMITSTGDADHPWGLQFEPAHRYFVADADGLANNECPPGIPGCDDLLLYISLGTPVLQDPLVIAFAGTMRVVTTGCDVTYPFTARRN